MNSRNNSLEKVALKATRWVGSTQSLMVHTLLFVGSFVLVIIGIPFEKVLLVLTTLVSLEAIYLSIFIQMSVNRSERRLYNVSQEVHEIQEDIEEITEDVGEIQEDIEQIEKDVDEISEDIEEIQEDIDEQPN